MNEASLPRWQIATAHSIYLNTAAELGLIGLLVGGCLLLMVGWTWLRRWQQTSNPSERIRLVACGAALAGLAVQTLVDTYTATPNILVIVAVVAYIVSDLKMITSPHLRPYTAYVALATLLIYAVGFAWITRADIHFQNSFREEGAGNLTEAVARASQAHTLDPDLTLRTFRLALLEARLADQTGDWNLVQTAVDHYQTGLEQEPILGLNSANLAGLLWQQGNRTEAIDTLQRTITAEEDPLYLVNLGYFYEQEGDWAKASAAYGRSLFLSPGLAASGFWRASPARAERWPSFVEAAVKQISPVQELAQKSLRVNLMLAQEDFDAVEALIGPVTSTTDQRFRVALAELYLSRGQPEQARTLLDPNPNYGQDYILWGRINLQVAEYATAEKMLKTAVFLRHPTAYYYLGQLYEQQGDLQAAEVAYGRGFSPHATAENIEVTIYGRPGANDLAPQLVRIGVGPRQAKSWLALARLYEKQYRFEEAKRVYEWLLAEDPFLAIAQDRLNLL
jgi:tetratricopeptide (TPR) repeat protein